MKKKSRLLEKLPFVSKKNSFLDRLILFFGVFGAVLILFLFARFIFYYTPQGSLSAHLSLDKTILYVEMETPSALPLQTSEAGEKIDFKTAFQAAAGLDLEAMRQTFGRGPVAYVLFEDASGQPQPIYFVQAKSQGAAMRYFKTLLLPNEDFLTSGGDETVYSFTQGQSFSFTFLDRYVAITQDPERLKVLLATSGPRLEEDQNYLHSIQQIPRASFMTGYVDVKKVRFSDNSGLNNVLEPLKHAVNNVAFSVREEATGFHYNTFVNLNPELLSLEEGRDKKRFAYDLTRYLPTDQLAFYAGGKDLANEWQNTLESISNLNPAYGLILEGLLRAQVDKFFGQNVDLRNDLYPLFEGEYAFGVTQSKIGKDVTLILSHDDLDFAQKKMEKMAQGFKFIAASFAPKVTVVTLPDGTESRELVPDDNQITNETETFEGHELSCTQVGEDHGFCYAVDDQNVYMSTSHSLLLKALDSSADHLSEDAQYRRSVSNLSKVTDEISFVRLEPFMAVFAEHPYLTLLKPYLSQFESSVWVKHYFKDGMSVEGYLLRR